MADRTPEAEATSEEERVISATTQEGIVTSCNKTRDIAARVLEGLIIMREDDDEDGWLLPDLVVINHAISALAALVQRAEDRDRFKRALERIGKEWTEVSATPDEIRDFARTVIAGGSARVPLAGKVERAA